MQESFEELTVCVFINHTLDILLLLLLLRVVLEICREKGNKRKKYRRTHERCLQASQQTIIKHHDSTHIQYMGVVAF